MPSEMTVSEARADLGPATSRAEYAGETTYLTKHGHRAAAIVSAGGAEFLEELEMRSMPSRYGPRSRS